MAIKMGETSKFLRSLTPCGPVSVVMRPRSCNLQSSSPHYASVFYTPAAPPDQRSVTGRAGQTRYEATLYVCFIYCALQTCLIRIHTGGFPVT